MPDSKAVLEDDVVVGNMPGSLNNPAVVREDPGMPVAVRADATRDYVSGASGGQWYTNFARALPWSLDDVTRDFGSDVYERMLMDSQVRAAFNVLKASILEEGITVSPAVEEQGLDGYDRAKQLAEDAEQMLDEIDLDAILWDMTDAYALGNRVAEQVFTLDTTYSGRRQYLLSRLIVKPRESIAFVVNAYMEVIGILGRIPGQPFSVQQGTLLADIDKLGNLLPASKFAVLTARPKNNDPRGTSVLRPAFDPWNQKQQLKSEFLKYLTQFASPSLIGNTAEGAREYYLTEDDGITPLLDSQGHKVGVTPESDMVKTLETFANGTAIALPFGALVKVVEMQGEGRPFLNAFQHMDQQIVKAILHQALATEEGEHQTRAATGTHKDILDTIIRREKRPVSRMMEKSVIRTWMHLNFGNSLDKLAPRVTLGTSEQEDVPAMWTAAAALQSSQYLDDSQKPKMDRILKLPDREEPSPEEVQAAIAAQAEKRQQMLAEQAAQTSPEAPKKGPATAPTGNGKVKAPVVAPTPKSAAKMSAETAIKEAAKRPPSTHDINDGKTLIVKSFQEIMDEIG